MALSFQTPGRVTVNSTDNIFKLVTLSSGVSSVTLRGGDYSWLELC